MERFVILLLHFLGFGLLVTVNVAGFIINRQYKKAPDLQSKVVLLKAMKPIGLLSPIAVLIMLITGIGNMHALGLGILDLGWLTAKIIFFAIAVISGIILGVQSGKRGKMIQQMVQGQAPANANELLSGYDRQVSLSYIVMPLLIIIILALSIYGKLGGQ